MKAILFKNLMNLSKQATTHLKHFNKHFTALFSLPPEASTYLAMYSNISLIVCTTANIKAPKAKEPKWYLKALLIEVLTGL